jgi:hypothetical protein
VSAVGDPRRLDKAAAIFRCGWRRYLDAQRAEAEVPDGERVADEEESGGTKGRRRGWDSPSPWSQSACRS